VPTTLTEGGTDFCTARAIPARSPGAGKTMWTIVESNMREDDRIIDGDGGVNEMELAKAHHSPSAGN